MKALPLSAILCSLPLALAAEQPIVKFSAHLNAAAGSSEINEALVANHAHDPNDEFTLQGLELSTSIKFTNLLAARASYNLFLDGEDKIDGEWEDAYLMGSHENSGLSYRAGRIFNQTNYENNLHLHSWQFVNSSLLTTRFMGEEGLLTESAELSWKLPFESGPTLSLSYGDAVDEEHEEGDEEVSSPFDVHGDESFLNTDILSTSVTGNHRFDDFHNLNYRAHYTSGTNGYGLDSSIYGLNLGYVWRRNGQEVGGKSFGISTEWVQSNIDYASENNLVRGNSKENAYALTSFYDFGNNWLIASRFEHIQGTSVIEDTPRLNRSSLALTRNFTFNDQLGGHVRLQYDYVNQADAENSNTAWLQLQLDFGSTH